MKTSSAIKVLDGKTRAVYKDEFPGVGLVQKHFIATHKNSEFHASDETIIRQLPRRKNT